MKIDPVVIHDDAKKWVEGKHQPTDKMREEYNPLLGFRSGNDLSCCRETMVDFLARYPASRSFLICFSWTVEAIHLPPAPDLDIFGGPLWAEKANASLELGRERMDERR